MKKPIVVYKSWADVHNFYKNNKTYYESNYESNSICANCYQEYHFSNSMICPTCADTWVAWEQKHDERNGADIFVEWLNYNYASRRANRLILTKWLPTSS